MDPLIARAIRESREVSSVAAKYTWVNIDRGEAPPIVDASRAVEMMKLPFDNTAAVATAEDDSVVVFLLSSRKHVGEDWAINAYVLTKGVDVGLIASIVDKQMRFDVHEDWFSLTKRVYDEKLVRDLMVYAAPLVTNTLRILYAMADRQYTAYVPELHPKAANRIAQGRVPTYEWRTVTIEPRVRPKAEPKGGTHASPRQHDRRGHWSHSKLGKRFWVPPCKVGKASNGTVFHDYVVKGEPAHAM